jgi:hypothetical protein
MPTSRNVLILLSRILLLCWILSSSALSPVLNAETAFGTHHANYKSYEAVAASGLITRVLYEVIARQGKSKTYTDLLPLDGGTVGIANFAKGGLTSLYQHMNTERYFGRSRDEMVAKYSTGCRPAGKAGDDTGWGCYSKVWWHNGMRAFLGSPESQSVQNAAWSAMMKPVIENAIKHGWTNERQIAIALGIANSLGSNGFTSVADEHNWDPEATLKAYVGTNEHRRRREQAIDEHFPKTPA